MKKLNKLLCSFLLIMVLFLSGCGKNEDKLIDNPLINSGQLIDLGFLDTKDIKVYNNNLIKFLATDKQVVEEYNQVLVNANTICYLNDGLINYVITILPEGSIDLKDNKLSNNVGAIFFDVNDQEYVYGSLTWSKDKSIKDYSEFSTTYNVWGEETLPTNYENNYLDIMYLSWSDFLNMYFPKLIK